MLTYDRTPKTAGGYDIDEETDETLREIVTADYIVFLLALDVYQRWLKQAEASGAAIANEDDLLLRGVALVKYIERLNLDTMASEIQANLSAQSAINLLTAALRFPPTIKGIAQRTMKIRILLTRNVAVLKSIFGASRKALNAVREALEAVAIDDPDQALAKIAAIDLKNPRLEKWVDEASEVAVPLGAIPVSPVQKAAQSAQDSSADMMRQRVTQAATVTSTEGTAAGNQQRDDLTRIESEATVAAQKAMVKAGEEDKPITRSEAIGVATAAAATAMNDPADQRNVPPMLQGLDPEQLSAAMSMGRVLVAAGAGSGKTSTVVSRVAHLIRDKGAEPSKILICCFNTKAAKEIKERLGAKIGGDLGGIRAGTMHSLFSRYVKEYGSREDAAAVSQYLISSNDGTEGKERNPNKPTPGVVGGAMARIWKLCHGGTPPPKRAQSIVDKWRVNDISPDKAAEMYPDKAEYVEWYRFYQAFKGDAPYRSGATEYGGGKYPKVELDGWKPCDDWHAQNQWGKFLIKYRDGGRAKLGDFSDQIILFRNLLRDNPGVRRRIQSQLDHICVDEAQDLNEVQHQIVDMLSEHISSDDPKKSVFVVGDESQSINSFAGARPDLFVGFQDKGFQLKNIATNYRCMPEIIEMANHLMEEHPLGLPLMARPDPKKPRGVASIVLQQPRTHADGALQTIQRISDEVASGQAISRFAVLTRTNREVNDFETACIVNRVPYARRGSTSFLNSSETSAVMGYVNLATSQDFKEMRKALIAVLNKPQRWLGFGVPGGEERVITNTLEQLARRRGVSVDQVNPLDVFSPEGRQILERILGLNPHDKRTPEVVGRIDTLGRDLLKFRDAVELSDGSYSTQDLIMDILNVTGAPETGSRTPVALRDALIPPGMRAEEDDSEGSEEAEDEEGRKSPVGNVQFLFMLAQSTGKPGDPADPRNFRASIAEMGERAKELRVDLKRWEQTQADRPAAEREPPPCVILSTIHCSPPDEPILTTSGWVPMGDLDPTKHRLASYDKGCNQLRWGEKTEKGFPFLVDSREYNGDLVTVQTLKSRTRITPNHKMLVRFSDSFAEKYVVYLMRRGDWWRMGLCVSAHRPYKSGGVTGRLATEKADAGWILKVCSTREEALMEEAVLQTTFGIPGTTFEVAKGRSLSLAQLHSIHESTKDVVGPRAREVLSYFGLSEEAPLYVRGAGWVDKREAFVTEACNLLGGYMDVPTPTEDFFTQTGGYEHWFKPEWHTVQVHREKYTGSVYSITVVPHRYYVSGGIVVHNSVKGAQWPDVTVVMAPGVFPHKASAEGAIVSEDEVDPTLREKRLDFLTERQLAYVAFTRAAEDLTVVSPVANLYGQTGPTPRFIAEAGLRIGQNVEGKNDPSPTDIEGNRTVLAWVTPVSEPFDDRDLHEPETQNSTYNRNWS